MNLSLNPLLAALRQELLSPEVLAAIADEVAFEVVEKLKAHTRKQDLNDAYIDGKEVNKLLHITSPTRYRYEKQGMFKRYKIGNRTLYKRAEVEAALTQMEV